MHTDEKKSGQPGGKVTALRTPSARIWQSRISWRIALAAFLTILTVQVGIMSVTVKSFRTDRLMDLYEEGRSALVPLISQKTQSLHSSPITDQDARSLLNLTKIRGVTVYASIDGSLLKNYGQPSVIQITKDPVTGTVIVPKNHYSVSGNFFDTVYKPSALGGRPYYMVVQLDSEEIPGLLKAHIEQAILIMLLMSAFVTTVLMIALGHWLLEPILFLRDNLRRASENPENPKLPESPFDPSDEIGGAISIASNLIRQNAENIRRIRDAAENQIHKLAYYDTLTGLPNRILFLQTLSQQAKSAVGTDGERFAVIAMDLDHFKDINDSMGHNIGDAILRAVGRRLSDLLPEPAIVARSGEDEFAVTMPLQKDGETAYDIAARVAAAIRDEPFKVFNEHFQIRASIGVATYPDDGTDPDQVLKNADIALNKAKEEGRDMIREYSEDFDRAVQQRFQLLRDLRDAMDHKQLRLHYQPQFDLNTGKIIGAEALLRWWKPDNSKEGGSFISPGDFIPIAESSGLIVPIGEWVMETACRDLRLWEEKGLPEIRMAVNVSGAQFYQSDIVAVAERILKENGLRPGQLELEVTESVFMEDVNHAVQTLQELHKLGVELAIDDFGTGYSSLSYLRQFPIDRLKIDQSFIRNALNNPDDAAIARTIVRLGHSLNLKVIAEGVETKEHETFLKEENCDEVQGFRYARPIPTDEFMAFVGNYTGNLESFD